MIQQLASKDYGRVAPLFRGLGRHPIVQGILEGRHPGMVFVDRPGTPRVSLLWALSDMLFLAGDAGIRDFTRSLPDLFDTTITRKAREIGQEFFQIQTEPSDEWAEITPRVFARSDIFLSYRWEFSFDGDAYRKLPPPPPLTADYEITVVDAAVLDMWPDLAHRIVSTWTDASRFFNSGIGYCAKSRGEFVGSCITTHEGAGACEISVNTDLAKRNQGVATWLCRKAIDTCVERGLLPCWGTETFRLPSNALARKLAFRVVRDFPTYCFPRDGPTDQRALGAYFYSEARPPAEASTNEDSSASAARGWSLAGDIALAARFTEEAVKAGTLDLSDLLLSPDFERLRAAPEWAALRARL
ncbi:GNAT family N-acetyltransferase [Bradyrhizobium ontarionense]|uniref:GNAT family N-acetyltransferase n=1 Tax=Bradyrhizobium ontarionense TaxID=2898149 RepID=A0ABY3RAM7_9BRAD|nr:GNAT family N-acetyltransferase [Bradyrhizobium sp. A19]UFZ04092.1 GNAT family N-acetyltransferase [Bradyrhizobium sp. A19]